MTCPRVPEFAMDDDPLADARRALDSGNPEQALRLAFKVAKPAVRQQDDATLMLAAALATEVAARSQGRVHKEASQLSVYWLACIDEPRDQQPHAWSFLSMFKRQKREAREPCPECAESIVVGAKVCRFCGHRLDAPE